MSAVNTMLSRMQVRKERLSAERLIQLTESLWRVLPGEREEAIAEIHNLAGQLPYLDDRDYGAVALEAAGDSIKEPDFKLIVYTHALYRARWCAQASTSGGEGLARAQHIAAIEAKLR
jgi:hypothetical protein